MTKNSFLNVGDTLTVDHDIIDISGNIILGKNQKVVVKEINKTPPKFSSVFYVYMPERINSVKLEDYCGVWILSTFKETKNINNH